MIWTGVGHHKMRRPRDVFFCFEYGEARADGEGIVWGWQGAQVDLIARNGPVMDRIRGGSSYDRLARYGSEEASSLITYPILK